MNTVLLEARPYRPFKSSEEYLYAMREDLAEWLNTLYPEMQINVENFMEKLDTGVSLCKHANNVRSAAEEYLARRQARQKSLTRSMTTGLAGPILSMGAVYYLPSAKSGTFFSRDNVSNFISWCRNCLQIFECLLFETDDLIMRKNEKNVILCLLEVARRGAKFGMLAPMLVQMERQIDREIAADNKANQSFGTQTDNETQNMSIGTNCEDFESDSEEEDLDDGQLLVYGPQPQIVTNDLKSLDEMVRDLVERCTCPSQFPMIRVSEGKYRIGDTKVLIFVRILRSHVMVRVGGGWDTLSNYLDKHDPCRCRAQHRTSVAAKLFHSRNQQNGIELHKAQVLYDRSSSSSREVTPGNSNNLSPSLLTADRNRSRSRSPNAQQIKPAKINKTPAEPSHLTTNDKMLPMQASNGLQSRSMSPSPKRLTDMRKKQFSPEAADIGAGDAKAQDVLSFVNEASKVDNSSSNDGANKYENISDNGSEISDEGYRSLGLLQSNNPKRISLQSQVSNEDAETIGRFDYRNSPEMTTTPTTETSESHKAESPISDEVVDAMKELEIKFVKSGLTPYKDESSLNAANKNELDAKKPTKSRIPKSPMMTRRKSMDNCRLVDEPTQKLPVYRSTRKTVPSTASLQKPVVLEKENTWNGRSSMSRPKITNETFSSSARSASLTRNSPTRSSQFDSRTRQRSSTRASSVNSSPNKSSNQQSPLAQQLLEAAGKARNDAQILDKIKEILRQYSKDKNDEGNDFTATWVNNNGHIDNDIVAPTKSTKKLSSESAGQQATAASNYASSSAGDANISNLRRTDKIISRIPTPIRSNTGLY